MKFYKKGLVIYLAIGYLFFVAVSCKAYRNPDNLKPKYAVESPDLAEILPGLQNLLVGDEIKVVGKDNHIRKLIFCGIEEDYLSASLWNEGGRLLEEPTYVLIPFNEIQFINVKRKSPGATIALVAGLSTVAVVSMTVLYFSILVNQVGFDD